MSNSTISIFQPDDWHLHLRDGDCLATTVPHTARCFARAVVMPNLSEPVRTAEQALSYRQRILAHCPKGVHFEPLMALYLTDETTPQEVHQAASHPEIIGFKWYPAGATTNSKAGVTDIGKLEETLTALQSTNTPLLIHAEVADDKIDIFEREPVFLESVLRPLISKFPKLKIVIEHITTRYGVKFVLEQSDNVAATITPHHLLYTRNALLAGGLKPHFYCLPVLKHETDRQTLVQAACSGNPKFFLGTDSAPHAQSRKENACGCAGIYSAHAAIELYTEVFERYEALDKLEAFACLNGAKFYDLRPNSQLITLHKKSWRVPAHYQFADEQVVPLRAEEDITWQLGK